MEVVIPKFLNITHNILNSHRSRVTLGWGLLGWGLLGCGLLGWGLLRKSEWHRLLIHNHTINKICDTIFTYFCEGSIFIVKEELDWADIFLWTI